MYLLTKMLFLASITLSLIGCLPPDDPYPNYKDPHPPIITQEYSGSKYFDSTLSENMTKEPSKIEITISTPFPPNNIPRKLDAWLTFIEKNGGKVTEEPAEGERDITIVVAALVQLYTLYEKIRKVALYAPARNYNAKLLIKKDESGDSMVSKIVFTHR